MHNGCGRRTNLLQLGFLARNFPMSTCRLPNSPLWTELKLKELAKFEAGKQSSAILSQHMRLISKRKAWRVARTTRGDPDLENLADITLTVPDNDGEKSREQIRGKKIWTRLALWKNSYNKNMEQRNYQCKTWEVLQSNLKSEHMDNTHTRILPW